MYISVPVCIYIGIYNVRVFRRISARHVFDITAVGQYNFVTRFEEANVTLTEVFVQRDWDLLERLCHLLLDEVEHVLV